MRNYTITHLHSTLSNDLYFDSVTNFEDYIIKAKDLNMDAIAFTEHANVFQWIAKKNKCDEVGIKYIHGCEFYLAFDLNKKERQNFHVILYAKNYDGVKEINKLSSISYSGIGEQWHEGIRFYYRPRISFEDLKNTSDNIIVSTACLASPIFKLQDTGECESYLQWIKDNPNKVFIEVQPHIDSEDQKRYNAFLCAFARKNNLKLIAGTDTHVLNKEDNELRNILQEGKKKSKQKEKESSDDEDESFFALHMRTCAELIAEFKEQGVLSTEEINKAIENTNFLSSLCENWKIDKSHKYPKISKNAESELWDRILVGVENRRISSYPNEIKKQYIEAIKHEYDTYVKLGMCDYILLLHDIILFCKASGIATALRGSANGSQSLWVLGISDIDPIKFGTLFFRFVNPERVSLGDADIDMSGENRDKVKDYLYSREGLNCSAIITFNKLALRGAFRMVAKGLGLDIETENMIADDIKEETIVHEDETEDVISIFENKEKWEKKYPRLIELAYKAVGIIAYASVHACGFVAFDGDIEEEVGVFRNKNSKWVISQNNMKAVDSVNFVKMDFLVVDNVQITDDAEKATGVFLSNDTLDLEDDNVWNEMLKSGLGIFQFEKSGWFSLKKALENYPSFVKNNPKATRYFIMLALNGVIRPSCASFREEFLSGVPHDNGHPAINSFFAEMNSYCIFQEQIMRFLEKFCHYTGAQSDTVRRAISKKGGTEKLIPEIESKFLEHFMKDYGCSYDDAVNAIKKFSEIIVNSKDYGFSINHSTPYTLLGYKNAYFRHYYPLEYLTVQLNVNDGKFEKTKNITEFIRDFTNIRIGEIKFRKSNSKYTFNKTENIIYKGLSSIKNIGEHVGEQLYLLKDNEYSSFSELLFDIKTKTNIDKAVVLQLIQLDFFTEFGSGKKLVGIWNLFYDNDVFKRKTLSKDKLPFDESIIRRHSKKETAKQFSEINFIDILKEVETTIANEDFSLDQKIKWQVEYIGSVNLIDPTRDKREVVITSLNTKYSPKLTAYCLANGKSFVFKVQRKPKRRRPDETYFEDVPFEELDVLFLKNVKKRPAKKKIDGEWVETGEIEHWIIDYRVLRRNKC